VLKTHIKKGESTMPTIFVNMIEGISEEQKKNMIKRVTEVSAKSVGVPQERAKIILTERSTDQMAVGGKLLSEGGSNTSLYPIVFMNTKVGKSDELLLGWKKDVAEAISETCNVPVENVAVYFIEHRL